MINENDAKTLNIVPDKEKQLHTYEITCHLVNGTELTYTLENAVTNRKEVIAALCTDRFICMYNEGDLIIRGINHNECVCTNMNLVTHVDIKELNND